MKYRALDANGDYQFGRPGLMLENSVQAVAQAIKTRLNLATGEWFLDLTEGTPYKEHVLGFYTAGTRDAVIKSRMLDTPGVVQLNNYTSSLDGDRKLLVQTVVTTQYGTTPVTLQV